MCGAPEAGARVLASISRFNHAAPEASGKLEQEYRRPTLESGAS